MRALFPELPEAFDNTVRIAERCRVELTFGQTQLPRFDAPGGDSAAYFRQRCYEGLRRHYGEHPDPAVTERLEYELSVIEGMGYIDYYLIVFDFINFARQNGIPVGPGRGSGAGSLAAYCIGITGIDPIQYNLLFERFLNPERVSMPDLDVYKRQGMGLGFTIALLMIGSIREILGAGTWFGLQVLPESVSPIAMFSLPPGGFLTFGFVVALANWISKGKILRRKAAGCAGCPSASACQKASEGGCAQ